MHVWWRQSLATGTSAPLRDRAVSLSGACLRDPALRSNGAHARARVTALAQSTSVSRPVVDFLF